MGSVCFSGTLRMQAIENDKNVIDDEFSYLAEYPYSVPDIFLDGCGEAYYPQSVFDWNDDSVVSVREKKVIVYTKSDFLELHAKDKDGNIIWVDGRTAPYANCWDGEYLDDVRYAQEYTIEEYNLETLEKKKYRMVPDETTIFDTADYSKLARFVDAEKLGSHFDVMGGVLAHYVGNDEDLVIPDNVTMLIGSAFWTAPQFKTISIPNTVVEIGCDMPKRCRTNCVHVAEDNPRYYTQDGCLIDKQTKTLVWAYAGNTIPNDGSVTKIGINAFYGRKDLKSIVIPDSVTEIGDGAFADCHRLEEISMPDVFADTAESIFGEKIVKKGDKWRFANEHNTFNGFAF